VRGHSTQALLRIATMGALAAALGLAGCGRKAGLDPPPGAAVVEPGPDGQQPPPALGPDGKPIPPKPGQFRWTPLDWLLN
jgi:predicted small lipoprotein YifL